MTHTPRLRSRLRSIAQGAGWMALAAILAAAILRFSAGLGGPAAPEPDSGLAAPAPYLPAQTRTMRLTKGRFLVAARSLRDPNFAETVVLLVDYSREGAMGLVINRESTTRLATLLPDLAALKDKPDHLFLGGPVARSGMQVLVRSESEPLEARNVFADVWVTASVETLETAAGRKASGTAFRAYSGYAGWAPGQLEGEVALEAWHVLPADARSIFEDDPGEVWEKMMRRAESVLARLPPGRRPGFGLPSRSTSLQ